MQTKVDLTNLTARTIDNVLTVIGQAQFTMLGTKIPVVNQELATLQSLGRKMAQGELVVVEPEPDAPDAEEEDVVTDGS